MVKLIHIMRAMEYKADEQHSEIDFRLADFGQFPYQAPSIFNFFLPEYQPSGPISEAELLSPEAQLLTAPYIVNFVNGVISLIKWGLGKCYQGFRYTGATGCGVAQLRSPWETWSGNLSYTPSESLSSTLEIINEMDVLLTGGRLNALGYGVIQEAYDTARDGQDLYEGIYDNLQAAQKLFIMSPEFHATNINQVTEETHDSVELTDDIAEEQIPYKAIVYVYLAGAADSFNIIVPYGDCNGTDDSSLYEQYVEVREDAALSLSDLLPIKVPNNTQPCNTFGIHSHLDFLQTLYNENETLFISNIGPLVEPISKDEYEAGTKEAPQSLFGHNTQELACQTVTADDLTSKGVIGRVLHT